MAAHITKFVFKSEDYFVAMLDNGGVRIGLAGYYMNDFAPHHAMFSKVVECGYRGDACEIEELSDAIYSINLQKGDCRILI